MEPEPVVGGGAEEAIARTRDLEAGDQVRVRGSKTVRRHRLARSRDRVARGRRQEDARRRSELERWPAKSSGPAKAPASFTAAPKPEPVTATTREVNVIGQRIEDAIPQIEKSLDEALLPGAANIRIVHGHGTGRLREAVREHFRAHPAVASLRAAEAREGGNGATIVVLR